MPVDSAANVLLPDSLRIHTDALRRGAGRVAGVARDLEGRLLAGVNLTVEGTGLTATTNDQGAFVLSGLPLGTQTLFARKVGFAPDQRLIDVLASGSPRADLSLATLRSVLDTVRVVAKRLYAADRNGFLRRQKTGTGYYIDPEQIEKARPFYVTDLLWRAPGVRVEGRGFDKQVLMRGMMGGYCFANIYIDGVYSRHFTGEVIDQMLTPGYVAGIELYASSNLAPPQFSNPFSSCGAVVIWTRSAPAAPSDP